MPTEQLTVTLDEAQRIIAAGARKADELGVPQNIAVADSGGNLVAHARMDGAWMGNVDISIDKAFTARMFDIPTQTLAEDAQSGGQFFGIQNSNHGRVMTFAGGVPLKCDGQICGAVGVIRSC